MTWHGLDHPADLLNPDLSDEELVEVERIWQDFWVPLVMRDGVLDLEQVKRELADCYTLIMNVPKVYCEVTGNRISKPLTDPDAVIGEFEEYVNRRMAECPWCGKPRDPACESCREAAVDEPAEPAP
jgi:hypothetical protein